MKLKCFMTLLKAVEENNEMGPFPPCYYSRLFFSLFLPLVLVLE